MGASTRMCVGADASARPPHCTTNNTPVPLHFSQMP